MQHGFRRALRLPLVLVLIAAALIARLDFSSTPSAVTGIADIRDGDSLVIGRHRIRLEGIDAPERDQNCQRNGRSWACGRVAQKHLARLVGNQAVECSVTKRDRFDRLLAICRVGNRDLNRSMIQDGMAVSFGRNYSREEGTARHEKLGIWSSNFERPRNWRRKNQRN